MNVQKPKAGMEQAALISLAQVMHVFSQGLVLVA